MDPMSILPSCGLDDEAGIKPMPPSNPDGVTATASFIAARSTVRRAGPSPIVGPRELGPRYRAMLEEPRLDWTEQHRILGRLGSGGQGTVLLCERVGADG